MGRLPIRVRLTLVFAIAMAAVLAVVGVALYQRLGSSVTQQIDDRLQARAATLTSLVVHGDLQSALSEPAADDAFVRVVTPKGQVRVTSPGFGIPPIATGGGSTPAFAEFDVTEPDGDRGRARALTTHATGADGTYVVTVGESVTDRTDVLHSLIAQLWLLGPIALVVASLLGYLVSRAALRPVEQMRLRAALIGAQDPEARLPVPTAADEVTRLAETLNAMLDRLAAGLRRERRFVADASHELRTPLACLQTELELATRRSRSPDELHAAIVSAQEEVERLARLAEDLLVLASADEGRLPLRPTQFDAHDLLTTVAGRFAARAAPLGRSLNIDAPPGTTVRADRLRLEQALGNLVDNALREGQGAVNVHARTVNGTTEFTVTDEGTGFPDDLLPTVFERFTRADGVRANGTTGLGLAIVQAIATAHGGSVTAANRPGAGAQVTLSLPVSDTPNPGDGSLNGPPRYNGWSETD